MADSLSWARSTLETLGADSIDLATIETMLRREKLLPADMHVKKAHTINDLALAGGAPAARADEHADAEPHPAALRRAGGRRGGGAAVVGPAARLQELVAMRPHISPRALTRGQLTPG